MEKIDVHKGDNDRDLKFHPCPAGEWVMDENGKMVKDPLPGGVGVGGQRPGEGGGNRSVAGEQAVQVVGAEQCGGRHGDLDAGPAAGRRRGRGLVR